MIKYCPKCKEDLSVELFNKSNRRDGYQTYCRACHNSMQREKYSSSPLEKVKRQIRAGRRKDRDPLVQRRAELKRLYGITLEDYADMFSKQNGVCAICKEECTTKKSLSVDHSHKTGKVRGLLCNGCNTSLGRFKDDVVVLKAAIKYLEDNE
jgi:cytochrome c peroxidase